MKNILSSLSALRRIVPAVLAAVALGLSGCVGVDVGYSPGYYNSGVYGSDYGYGGPYFGSGFFSTGYSGGYNRSYGRPGYAGGYNRTYGRPGYRGTRYGGGRSYGPGRGTIVRPGPRIGGPRNSGPRAPGGSRVPGNRR